MFKAELLAIAIVALGLFRSVESHGADDYGLEAGKRMPFHIARFVGERPGDDEGCPSVMIANGRGRGIIIWSRGLSDAAFRLAKGLDADADKEDLFQRFLVAFDADEKEFAKKAEGLRHLKAGIARQSAEQELDRRGVGEKTKVLVFLLDKRIVARQWSMTQEELSDDKVKEILSATKKFAAEAK